MDDTHADEAVLHLDSVDFNELRPGESTLARLMIRRVREGGAMIGGVFAEALIAEVTGASFPRFGISSWDLKLDEITIQVRASSRGVFIRRYVDGALLTDLWPDLVLPRELRSGWQDVIANTARPAEEPGGRSAGSR